MSQNSNTLLLYFQEESTLKSFQELFNLFEGVDRSAVDDAERRLGVSLSETWYESWFNQDVGEKSGFIELNYDTSTGEHLPLTLLKQLFAHGLRAAALEVFFDQVGEFEQYHFADGLLVERSVLIESCPRVKSDMESCFECGVEELAGDGLEKPVSIDSMIKNSESHDAEVQCFIAGMMSFTEACRETDSNPYEVLKHAMVLKAVVKGVLQAVLFGILTVLLFKGMWLWIALTILLIVVLPIYYVSRVAKDYDSEDQESPEGSSPC